MWDHQWLGQFPQVKFEPDAAILRIGTSVTYNYYLEKGLCAKMVYSSEGEETVLRYYDPGEMLGIHLYRYGRESVVDFIATTPCVCRKIPSELVQDQLRTNSTVCYGELQNALDELDMMIDSTIAHIFGGGISVICWGLKTLATPQTDGTLVISHVFTNTELAKFCGIHVVSVSRFITQLQNEGIITRSKDGIIINDIHALENHIELDA